MTPWPQTLAFAPNGTKLFWVSGFEDPQPATIFHAINPSAVVTKITLAASHAEIVYGQSVTLTVHLTGPSSVSGKKVSILQTDAAGHQSILKVGAVNGSGVFSFTTKPPAKRTYVARFAGDANDLSSQSAPRVVLVKVIVAGHLSGYYGTSGSYKLYHYSTNCQNSPHTGCPTFTVTVTPNLAGKAVHFLLQGFSGGKWNTDLSFNGKLGSNSSRTEVFIYKSNAVIGQPTRVNAAFPGDTDYAASTSPWFYFKVTN